MTEERLKELQEAWEKFTIFDSLSPQECSEMATALLAAQKRVAELQDAAIVYMDSASSMLEAFENKDYERIESETEDYNAKFDALKLLLKMDKHK